MAVTAAAVLMGLCGCAGSDPQAPTVPELTYAVATEAEPTPTAPTYTVTASTTPTPTSDDEVAPSANPAVDDLVQYAAIDGSELSGAWHGGCRHTPSVGLTGMTWRAEQLHAADGSVLASVTVEVSIRSTASDGTHEVEAFSLRGVWGDGRTFAEHWEPHQQLGEVYGTSSEGVSTIRLEGGADVGEFDLRAYCN